MFERYSKPLLPRHLFLMRVLRYTGFTLCFLGISIGIGILGYHFFNDIGWLDSLLNASMILTGMGPVDPMKNDGAKWFASVYAIFSGVAFLSIVAVFLSPIVHRFLHKHNLDDYETHEKTDEKTEGKIKKPARKKSGRKQVS